MGGVISRSNAVTTDCYLSRCERQRIGDRQAQEVSILRIAERMGMSLLTVSREASRNMTPWDATYEPAIAHLRAHKRAGRPGHGKVE